MCAPPDFSVRAISFAGRSTCSKKSCVITRSKDSSREILPSILRGTRVSPADARPHSGPIPRSTHTFLLPAATYIPLPECTAGIYLVELDRPLGSCAYSPITTGFRPSSNRPSKITSKSRYVCANTLSIPGTIMPTVAIAPGDMISYRSAIAIK